MGRFKNKLKEKIGAVMHPPGSALEVVTPSPAGVQRDTVNRVDSTLTDFDKTSFSGIHAENAEEYIKAVDLFNTQIEGLLRNSSGSHISSSPHPDHNNMNSFCSAVTDFDNLTCPGAQAEMSEDYMKAVDEFKSKFEALLKQPHVAAAETSSSTSMHSPATSMHSTQVGSFGSTVTDYDNLTCPSAQAERNEEHMNAFGRLRAQIGTAFNPHAFIAEVPSAASQSRNHPDSFGSVVTDYDNITCPGARAEMNEDYTNAVYGRSGSKMGGYGLMSSSADAASRELGMPAYMVPCSPLGPLATNPLPQQMPSYIQTLRTSTEPQDFELAAAQLREAARLVEEHASNMRGQPSQFAFAAQSTEPVPYGQACGVAADVGGEDSCDSEAGDNVPLDCRTTLILRNLPNDYTRAMLLELLDSEGFYAKYDFVYLPLDIRRMTGLGYAFINMINHDCANSVTDKLNGYSTWKKKSIKVLEVDWCKPMQGLKKHVQRYRNCPLMHDSVPDFVKPAIFVNGTQATFPLPTKQLQPPRLKGRAAKGNTSCRA